jgi:hypothetical protein
MIMPENPYQAAHRFLTKNDLPLTYIDEVANFIDKNTSAVRIGTVNNQYQDPYTGQLPDNPHCILSEFPVKVLLDMFPEDRPTHQDLLGTNSF